MAIPQMKTIEMALTFFRYWFSNISRFISSIWQIDNQPSISMSNIAYTSWNMHIELKKPSHTFILWNILLIYIYIWNSLYKINQMVPTPTQFLLLWILITWRWFGYYNVLNAESNNYWQMYRNSFVIKKQLEVSNQ